MPRIELKGFKQYIELLDITAAQANRMVKKSVYPGAKIVANQCKKEIRSLVTDEDRSHGRMRNGPTKADVVGLINSLGIAKGRYNSDGTYDVKLGFDGYNELTKSKRHPKGLPNMMVARSVNSGTSFMKAQPFMEKTIRLTERDAVNAMSDQFDKELERIWK